MKATIYLVDDDPSVRDIFRIILKGAGYEVVMFESGKDLLKNAEDLPDLFILDQNLPDMNGLDICKGLKGNHKTKHIPVIIVSATPDLEIQIKEVCADDYLKKPLTKKDLLSTIANYIGEGVKSL
jgi:DNA-binding response OmpR family regulator